MMSDIYNNNNDNNNNNNNNILLRTTVLHIYNKNIIFIFMKQYNYSKTTGFEPIFL